MYGPRRTLGKLIVTRYRQPCYTQEGLGAFTVAGVPYETLTDLKGVQQLDKYDDTRALVLMGEGASLDLRTITLP